MDKKKLSFILYQNSSAPSYFEIRKGMFRFLFIILPFVACLAIMAIFAVMIYFKQIKRAVQKKEPQIIAKLRDDKRALLEKQTTLINQRDLLEQKLALGPADLGKRQNGLSTLALFKQTLNRKDLSQSPELALDEFQVTTQRDKIKVEFQITNLTEAQKRISGYIFVLMQEGSRLSVWPLNSFSEQEMDISFIKGEQFATSRFRPVVSSFDRPKENELLFKVLVFSRLGDLIFKKLVPHTM